MISSRIPHFYNKCLRRIYQPNRLDVGGYTADHRSLALALVGKLECVHLLVLWTWNALFVDVSTISLYFTNMFWAECLQIPAAAVRPLVRESRIWAERGWRGVTYCGRGSPHYSARGTLTIIWPLSPVSAPENEHFHSTVSFKLPH